MLICDRTKQPHDFPSVPTLNMKEIAQSVQDVKNLGNTYYVLMEHIIDCYDNSLPIYYDYYLSMLFLYDVLIGELQIDEIKL
jgi:hypothetical protein